MNSPSNNQPRPAAVKAAHHPVLTSLDEALASGELRQLKAEARALAADGANWSMDVGCMFVLAMIERIESRAASPKVAGYIEPQEIPCIGQCRTTLWATKQSPDALAVYLAVPADTARIAELEAEIAKRRRSNWILSQTIHNIMVGNQSAWIEWQQGDGAEKAMEWIQNGLIGPGLIPVSNGKSAQEFCDANSDYRMEPTDPHPPGKEL